MKYLLWKLKVNVLGIRYLDCCPITSHVDENTNREAFEDGETPYDYFMEGWCRE